MKFKQKWDLDTIYEGGSHSEELSKSFESVSLKMKELGQATKKRSDLKSALKISQEISFHLREMSPYITCLNAQNVTDSKAHLLQDQITALQAEFSNLSVCLGEWLASLDETTFHTLLAAPDIEPIAFAVEEKRRRAKDLLSSDDESFINDLGVNGYHGWTQMWEALLGNITFPFEGKELSFGQIENQMADPSREIRQLAFQSIDTTLRKNELLFAQILNHLGGFRLATYKKRRWTSILKEPLDHNRMEEETLQAMWSSIQKHHNKLKAYLKCKADLLKIPEVNWYDLEAPLGEVAKKVPFDEAGDFIIRHFSKFSPKMGAFAKKVLEDSWIDAENRAKKGPGGFCVGMPLTKESRIFMTYADTMTNVFTLAHELGHAFHNLVTFPLPEMSQHICMNVAETASTMAEAIVTRAAIEEASSETEKLFLLDDHLSRSVAYLMNIYARFLFETRFYAKRKQGFVSSESLNNLMKEAQKEAYGDSLGCYHPLFWAAKMHFYFADAPFYNFPYTFGYLFSMGIHELGQKKDNFEDAYIALLQDTGQMNVEDLAQKHLSIDLRKEEFWEIGLKTVGRDIDEFIALAEKVSQ